MYPNSTPEFRVLQKQDGTMVLQIRYINISQGYTSAWKNVPVVKEDD